MYFIFSCTTFFISFADFIEQLRRRPYPNYLSLAFVFFILGYEVEKSVTVSIVYRLW